MKFLSSFVQTFFFVVTAKYVELLSQKIFFYSYIKRQNNFKTNLNKQMQSLPLISQHTTSNL